jgi:hypothetical protein
MISLCSNFSFTSDGGMQLLNTASRHTSDSFRDAIPPIYLSRLFGAGNPGVQGFAAPTQSLKPQPQDQVTTELLLQRPQMTAQRGLQPWV